MCVFRVPLDQHFVSGLFRWQMLIKAADDIQPQSRDDPRKRFKSGETTASWNDEV